MENPNSTLLPYILEILSQKENLSDSLNNLCEAIETQLKREKREYQFRDVRKAIKRSINVGQSLGILTLTEEFVPTKIQLKKRTKRGAPANLHAQTQKNKAVSRAKVNANRPRLAVKRFVLSKGKQVRIRSTTQPRRK